MEQIISDMLGQMGPCGFCVHQYFDSFSYLNYTVPINQALKCPTVLKSLSRDYKKGERRMKSMNGRIYFY